MEGFQSLYREDTVLIHAASEESARHLAQKKAR
ncbi:MAG: hypothetical protein IDH24_02085 [Gordonia sp.]|nr:hypothetical protein [Gordonia sp. (in: high G+C Gram-positive bacteria)]